MTMSSLKTYQNVASAASSRPFRHVGDDFPAYVANDILCAIERISREQIEHPGAEIRIDRLLPRGNIRAAMGHRVLRIVEERQDRDKLGRSLASPGLPIIHRGPVAIHEHPK